MLDFADEQSVVQTVFATTVLMLLRGSLGESLGPVIAAGRGRSSTVGAAPRRELESADQITFLGQDWAYGIAQEAALKMREAAQLWTESYPQMEYRHGPIAIAQPGRAVWVFGQSGRRASPTTSPPPARRWSTTTSTRSPTWSGPSCSPYAARRPSGSTRTDRAT